MARAGVARSAARARPNPRLPPRAGRQASARNRHDFLDSAATSLAVPLVGPAPRLTAHDRPGRARSPGTSPGGRRDRHPPGLPGLPARHPGVEVRGTGRGRLAGNDPPSSITLGGLLKHLAYVESDWFSRWLHGQDREPPWDTVDWKADPDWEWHSAAEDTPEQLRSE